MSKSKKQEPEAVVEPSYTERVQGAIKRYKLSHYLTTLIMIIVGVVLVAEPELAIATICTIVGIMLVITGIAYIVWYFVRDNLSAVLGMDLVFGILITALGILILTHADFVLKLINVILGVIMIFSAVIKLQTAIDMKRLGVKRWWITLIFSVICVIMGIVMIRNPFEVASALIIYVGTCFIVDGIVTLFSMIALGGSLRRVKRLAADTVKEAAKETIDVDAEEKPLEW